MIVIHAKGNEDIGIGNLSRAYELICYLEETQSVIGIFECSVDLFSRYKRSNILISNSLEHSLEIIEKSHCSTYISDLVSPTKVLSDKLRLLGVKTIIHFNGLEHGFEPDILFVTNGFDYPINVPNVTVHRGFEYYVIGREVVNARTDYYPIKAIKNVLISFGGADPAFYTEYFAEIIQDTKYNYTIVLGPAMSNERKKQIKSIKKENLHYLDSPIGMTKLLLKNDLLITLGGMTTYEAMCLGIPVAGVRWQYLEYVVKSFGEKNMVNDLGNIDNAYQNLLNLDVVKVNKTAQNAFKMIDGSALINIEKVIRQYR